MSVSTQGSIFFYAYEVGFGDCDPAQIIYFPRYFDLFHQTMERWMTHALGWNYAQSIRVRKVGFPTVHHEADFKISSGLGETIRLGLRLSRIGNRSFDLQYRVFGSDSDVVRAIARATCATVDLEPEPENVAAIAIPSELRQKMQAFGVSSW